MSGAATWIGPAIVAAVISALVTGMGWFVSDRQSARRDAQRRRERIADVQTALLAEIRAGRYRLGSLRSVASEVDAALAELPTYTPFVTRPVPTFVLDAVLPDIHLLPDTVIDPIVIYYRQMSAISLFVDDLRSERYEKLTPDRKRAMYSDYVDLLLYSDVLAAQAADAIRSSLNMTVAARSDQLSAAGPDEASGSLASGSPLNKDKISPTVPDGKR